MSRSPLCCLPDFGNPLSITDLSSLFGHRQRDVTGIKDMCGISFCSAEQAGNVGFGPREAFLGMS